MLLDRNHSALLLIDVQERLVPIIYGADQMIEHCAWLIRLARAMQVPLLASEQYPKGLGPTVPALRQLLGEGLVVDKVHFSCAAPSECRRRIDTLNASQIVVAGVEAHVCVLQTVLALLGAGKQVFPVAQAISSHDPAQTELAMVRMRQAGAQIVSHEMVMYEWLEQADTDTFRSITREFVVKSPRKSKEIMC